MQNRYWSRKRVILLVCLLVIGAVAMLFVSHNQRFYQRPIAQVEKVRVGTVQKTTDQFKNVDHEHQQTLTVRLLNTRYRGKQLQVSNTYSDSQPMDQRYQPGNQLFLTQLKKSH